jgi:predicted house-cleaning NTP pyrophosphatase (Maf/HAM1 superfamily)
LGALLVEEIDGDYFNVVGLPLNALAESLKEFGISAL